MQFKKGRERLTDIVAEKLKLLPDSPGVYIMKDASGRIIYVGKAVVLKNRVRQYFQHNKNHSPKVKAMVSHIADFEIIMTHSEVEALILECNLIKKHRPHYNISLKDDKSYPYVKVTVQEEYPRVFLTDGLRGCIELDALLLLHVAAIVGAPGHCQDDQQQDQHRFPVHRQDNRLL
mgnify:CR=1 FL=1